MTTDPSLPDRSCRPWPLALFVAAAVAVAVGYALYTDHVWEDFFITFRFSRNLCDGKGLVYQPGERVHGFTSPLGTLLPALCYAATGKTDYVSALWLFRALSIAAFAGGGVLLLLGLAREHRRVLPAVFLALLYLTDFKAVAFTVNGMETGLLLLFAGWAAYLAQTDGPGRWLPRGLCWAGLLWTRPDGCVYVAALALAEGVFPRRPRRALLADLVRSAGVAALVYLPWVAWAWWYYGSPVPHTVIAKANYPLPGAAGTFFGRFDSRAPLVFAPIYYQFPGWSEYIGVVSTWLAVFAAAYWLLPVRDRFGRMMSLVFAVLGLYLLYVPKPFPWYLAPLGVCGLAVLASGVAHLGEVLRHRAAAAGVLTAAVACQAGILVVGSCEMRLQQRLIEDGHRKQIGLWLHDRVQPGEHVFAECIGYIGYFSDAAILDYPGLVSPAVVRAVREHHLENLCEVIRELQPEWVVLRPGEYQVRAAPRHLTCTYTEFRQDYTAVADFNVRDEVEQALAAYPFVPRHQYLTLLDSEFTVFRRNRSARRGAPER